MTQLTPTPPWGTPTTVLPTVTHTITAPADGGTPPPAEPSIEDIDPGSSKVQLRVTALHFALKIVGERGTVNLREHATIVRRVASELERELLTGQWQV